MKCLNCVGVYKQFLAQQALSGEPISDEDLPEMREAISMVPIWQNTQVGGAIIYACVAVPSCLECMEIREPTAMEKAMQSGILLPAAGSLG